MKKLLAFSFGLVAWFAVVAQYFLMLENRTASIAETTIRFFSFFTILTNALVAVYFTVQLYIKNRPNHIANKPGTLTAITIYILVVGLVYQVLLRDVWQPTGLQKIVDELLHSIIPILVAIYWWLYENKTAVQYKQFLPWLVYPLAYLVYILVRGSFSGFYPYPFVDVTKLGLGKVLLNAFFLLLFFCTVSLLMIRLGKLRKG